MKRSFKRFSGEIIDILKRPDMQVLPGQLAFFFMLSIVPTFTLIGYMAQFMKISLEDVATYFNFSINPIIAEYFMPSMAGGEFKFAVILMFIFGIYIISNGTNSIIVTANNIYGIKQKGFLRRRIKALIMVVILLLLFMFMFIVPILGNFFLGLIEKFTGYNEIYNVITFLKLPFSWLIMFVFIKVLYMLAPDKQVSSSHVNVGALFSSIGWIVATEIYLYYITHIADYSLLYSGLANVAILMVWVYILSTIFVIGMALNYKEEPYSVERKKKKDSATNNNHNKKWYEE